VREDRYIYASRNPHQKNPERAWEVWMPTDAKFVGVGCDLYDALTDLRSQAVTFLRSIGQIPKDHKDKPISSLRRSVKVVSFDEARQILNTSKVASVFTRTRVKNSARTFARARRSIE
jgi:hypothetical protein